MSRSVGQIPGKLGLRVTHPPLLNPTQPPSAPSTHPPPLKGEVEVSK